MKKTLVLGVCAGLLLSVNALTYAHNSYLDPQTAGNANFRTLTQKQFEKQETLDFINESEQYKQKREKKDRYLDYQAGKVDVPKSYGVNSNNYYSRPGDNNMQFTKDENGRIIIRNAK